jgi:hypothetical protein
MATPRYDDIKAKLRDWSNKRETSTTPESVIEDCLRYGSDDIYRYLRIPQLEFTTRFTISESENSIEDKYTVLEVPQDLIEFVYLRQVLDQGRDIIFNEVTDIRTFLDPYAENYSRYRYIWKDLQILVHPKLEIGDVVELNYYRRLAQLDATYTVIAENYNTSFTPTTQPLLTVDTTSDPNAKILYIVLGGAVDRAFNTLGEATAYISTNGGSVLQQAYLGNEAWNWLRDANEKLLLQMSLSHLGAYLFDDSMESKYMQKAMAGIEALNKEEKFRRAKGGNVRMNFDSNGLI